MALDYRSKASRLTFPCPARAGRQQHSYRGSRICQYCFRPRAEILAEQTRRQSPAQVRKANSNA